MQTPPSPCRPPSPNVPAIDHAATRYQQASHTHGEEPGSFLVATDLATGAQLWRVRIYGYPDVRKHGVEAIGRFFASMRLLPDEKTIEIVDETGGIYHVDLETRSVSDIDGPPAHATPKAEPDMPIPRAPLERDADETPPKRRWYQRFF